MGEDEACEYDPKIQAVIDRVLPGEIEVKNRPVVDPDELRQIFAAKVTEFDITKEIS